MNAIDKNRTLQDLLALREGWESQKSEAEQAIRSLDQAIRLLRPESGVAEYKPPRQSFSALITDAIESMLTEERPLHRKDILHRLEQNFSYIGGSDPLTTLGAMLSRDRRFKNAKRGYWTLTVDPERDTSAPISVGVSSKHSNGLRQSVFIADEEENILTR